MKGDKEIEMSEMNDEKETDIDAEIEKAEVKMVSFGELVSSWYKMCPMKTCILIIWRLLRVTVVLIPPHAEFVSNNQVLFFLY